MGLFAPIRRYIETLVHPSVRHDVVAAARHRAFIAPRLIGSIVALASFPIYLLVRGAPGAIELIVFAWFVVPILTAAFLSRTGRFEIAHGVSALALTGLATVLAILTGGITSFAAIWLVVVPLEAALSASRRIAALATTFALGAAGLLMLLDAQHQLPPPSPNGSAALAALGIVSAALYATAVGVGAKAVARASLALLYAEESRYRLLARNITDVITRHRRDGAVRFVSPAAEALFGSRIAELLGHGLFDRVHVADRPAYLTALGDAAALAEARSVEFRVRRDAVAADGRRSVEFVWIEMRCRPLQSSPFDNGAEDDEVVAVLRDVTERKEHQEALSDAHAEAARANAAKTRFLATMSHELRTPLNAIIGFSDMLTQEAGLMLDAKRRNEYAGLINDSGHHLLGVVNGILDMSKIETGNFAITAEPFAPAPVVAGCCSLLALRASEAGVTLEQVATDLPEMVGDKRALNQILLNLLSNAIRFTDRGGKVTIGARAEAASVTFVVEDNGVGISEEDLARVGEPYFQAGAAYDRRYGGTGLGLSIVKGLVQLHGGEISIRSRVGEGTRVTVRLPLDCERARPAKNPAIKQSGTVISRLVGNAAAHATARAAMREISMPRSEMAVKKRA